MATADETISSYINCAKLEERPIDWMEIRDALAHDGVSELEADAAIGVHLARMTAPTDLRQTAWELLDIFSLNTTDLPTVRKYDRILRDLEDEYTETATWEQVVRELRDLTLTRGG